MILVSVALSTAHGNSYESNDQFSFVCLIPGQHTHIVYVMEQPKVGLCLTAGANTNNGMKTNDLSRKMKHNTTEIFF